MPFMLARPKELGIITLTELGALVVVAAVKFFAHYLYDRKLFIQTTRPCVLYFPPCPLPGEAMPILSGRQSFRTAPSG